MKIGMSFISSNTRNSVEHLTLKPRSENTVSGLSHRAEAGNRRDANLSLHMATSSADQPIPLANERSNNFVETLPSATFTAQVVRPRFSNRAERTNGTRGPYRAPVDWTQAT